MRDITGWIQFDDMWLVINRQRVMNDITLCMWGIGGGGEFKLDPSPLSNRNKQ